MKIEPIPGAAGEVMSERSTARAFLRQAVRETPSSHRPHPDLASPAH